MRRTLTGGVLVLEPCRSMQASPLFKCRAPLQLSVPRVSPCCDDEPNETTQYLQIHGVQTLHKPPVFPHTE